MSPFTIYTEAATYCASKRHNGRKEIKLRVPDFTMTVDLCYDCAKEADMKSVNTIYLDE